MLFVVQFFLLVVIIKHALGQTCLSNEAKEDFDKSRKALKDVQENIGKVTNKLENDNKKILGIFKDTLNTMGQKIKKLDTDLKVIGTKFENDNKKRLVMFKGTLNTMGQKIKKLDTDFKVLGEDFRSTSNDFGLECLLAYCNEKAEGQVQQETKWHKYNGHCYYYSPETKDWFTAERKCREIGGYIVKIDDKEENSNIAANKANSGHHYWIGLIDLKEGEWRWTYDQSKAEFTNWLSGYGAKGTGSNCVILHYNRADWFDYNCHYKSQYICESNFCF